MLKSTDSAKLFLLRALVFLAPFTHVLFLPTLSRGLHSVILLTTSNGQSRCVWADN